MSDKLHLYFKNDAEWRAWLHKNHSLKQGVYLIFYTIAHEKDSMRWEEAVRVALCYGWIDSTVKSLGDGKRKQYFCLGKPKSVWSKLNKMHIKKLTKERLMHESGLKKIKAAKKDGSWTALDNVENGIIPEDLQKALDSNPSAYLNYQNFTSGQRKNYLYWLYQAKRTATRERRINEIVTLCMANIKSRLQGTR